MILFRDGLEVEEEMLQREWRLPLRKLVLAMPITAALIAAITHLLIGLSWTESFLLGALLSPTDPVLTSNIVTNPRVPRVVRHSLNLESGLNDGLALPAVLAFAAALDTGTGSEHFVWESFVVQDIGLGFLYGIACGWVASLLMPHESARHLEHSIPSHQKSLYALGTDNGGALYTLDAGFPLDATIEAFRMIDPPSCINDARAGAKLIEFRRLFGGAK